MDDAIQIRAAKDDDAERIADFINVCRRTYQGIARSSIEDANARLRIADSDPSTDAFIALKGDQYVGFAHLWRFSPAEVRCFARVHPDAQGMGIGSELLHRGRTRAEAILRSARPEAGPLTITATHWARDVAAVDLFKSRGFSAIRHFLAMVIAADRVHLVAEWPEGAQLRPMRSGDEDELYAAFRDAFAEHWGTADDDSASWWRERQENSLAHRLPSPWLLAVAGDEIVGFAHCELKRDGERTLGRVSEIGVRKVRRGLGIGRAVLISALQVLRVHGASEITLDVDSDNMTSAIKLYLEVGMVARPAFTVWQRDLSAN